MYKIPTFHHAVQASDFHYDIIYKFKSSRPEVLFNNSYYKNFELFTEISEVKLIKLWNECHQLHYHSTSPRLCFWDLHDIFRTAKFSLTKLASIKYDSKVIGKKKASSEIYEV